ncbi:hypothetical protein CFC21_071921 [Triticum aestivum]|uniref:Uncharacterized protein n=3 Tax=Triticum TaxID=4564 RepID=A0A9R0XAJ2_TRITD|nr:uncharacterized protein LOC119305665 [Triticum dicoccoides]XP_044393198.1 uncharacterized protein LOC123116282 [Triticum aestivum]KAF7065850.1 hypothetical protein CFC21_071921 [Triticum aestivum]VAI33095.1 unnamed protein product [Triticum turgidum subsp. durum]
MACVNMYNPEHHQSSFMAPRMSFSSDFALEPPPASAPSARGPGDADFEFSVGSRPMMAADELFSKGRLLPLREAPHGQSGRPTTLREELRTDDRHGRAPRAPNIRWKELLGFKKANKKAAAAAADAGASTSSAEAHTDLGGHGGTRE